MKVLRIAILINLVLLGALRCSSQSKPPLDLEAAAKWMQLEGTCGISNDGNYIYYIIENLPVGSNTLTIKSVLGDWKKDVVIDKGHPMCEFSKDSKFFHFVISDNSCWINLINHQLFYGSEPKSTGSILSATPTGKITEALTLSKHQTVKKYFVRNGEFLFEELKPNKSTVLITKEGIPDSLELGNVRAVSLSANVVYLTLFLKTPALPKVNEQASKVVIWSYKDKKVQSVQSDDAPKPEYIFAYYLKEKYLKLIGNASKVNRVGESDFWVVNNESNKTTEWRDLKKHNRLLITFDSLQICQKYIPELNRIIYYDKLQKEYMSLDMSSGKLIDLTAGISENWDSAGFNKSLREYTAPRLPPVWWTKQKVLVVFARNDIWLLDPFGVKDAVCLTKTSGARNHIKYNIWPNAENPAMNKDGQILISAFDERTKEHGNYYTSTDDLVMPSKINMQKMLFCANELSDGIKAKNADVYLCLSSTNFGSENYFTTLDFKTFKQQSFVYPESNYNWETKELLNYPVQGRDSAQAVLHKPEDFDPLKKYPLIFYCYEGLSQKMYASSIFKQSPVFSKGPISIPWFVSHGYLVLEVDIKQNIAGEIGQTALRYINAAADYVSKLPYVDSTKMGIQGHSFGAFETNYIVSHTTRFAAALAADGVSDAISHYTLGNPLTTSIADGWRPEFAESGQPRMGSPLWTNLKIYLDNSPLLSANKVRTPILLVHNKLDGNVPTLQSEEFYTVLRRLNKKVWWIEYEDEGHSINRLENQKDYTIRVQQFFDHYLKGLPPPEWMTIGIPKYMKGRTDGLALDTSGRQP